MTDPHVPIFGDPQFHLVVERVPHADVPKSARRPRADRAPAAEHLVVPAGHSYLLAPPGQKPSVTTAAPAAAEPAFSLEPIRVGYQRLLLLASHGSQRPHVNGVRVPSLSVVREKDALQVSPEFVLHACLFHQPSVAAAPAHVIGKECLVDRSPIREGMAVYICPGCGAPMHCDGPEIPKADRLECARLVSECPGCQTPVSRRAGYSYLPDEVASP